MSVDPDAELLLFSATFVVHGIPQPKGSAKMLPRGKRPDGSAVWVVASSNDNLAAWEQAVVWTAKRHAPRSPLVGPVELTVEFRFPVPKSAPKRQELPMTTKPDTDKLLRAIGDALGTAGFYVDDAQITDVTMRKRRAYWGGPGVTITVRSASGLSRP